MAAEKLVTLKCSDGALFEVTEEVGFESAVIKAVVEEGQSCNCPLPLHRHVSSKILTKVIEYCKYHVGIRKKTSEDKPPISKDEINAWDAEFLKVDQSTLFEMITAANYLDIQSLLDLCCKEVAYMMKGKTAEEIRIALNIINDYTPEEEAKLRRDNAWAFVSSKTSSESSESSEISVRHDSEGEKNP